MFVNEETREAQGLHDALRGLVAHLQPGNIPLREVSGLCDVLVGIEQSAGAALTLLADRLAESEVWKREGYPSAAEYMASKAGTSAQAARNTLATSKRLQKLPETETALRRGELSRDQTDAIADAAAHDPASEPDLLDLAQRSSLMELRQECLRRKAAADPDPETTRRRIHKNRKLRTHTDAEGAWNLYGRGPLPAGADVTGALDLICDELFRKARSEGRQESRDAYMFDALQILARWGWDIYYGDTPTWDITDPGVDDTERSGDAQPNTSDADDRDGATASHGSGPDGSAGDETDPDGPMPSRATQVPAAGDENGNGTGEAGAVSEDVPASSRPGSQNTPADRARTDRQSRDGGSDSRLVGDHDDLVGDHDDDDSGHGGNREQRRQMARRRKRKGRQVRPNRLVLVHASLQALVRGSLEPGERCEMPGRGPLDLGSLRRMLPDAIVKLVMGDGDRVVSVAHLGRGLDFDQLLPTRGDPRSTSRRPRWTKPRYLVLLHLDTASLHVPAGDDQRCEIPGVGSVAGSALRALVADWAVDRLVGSAVDVTELSYRGRGLNTAQLIAQLWSQPLCSVEGCNRYRVEYDHRNPWAAVRITALDNIDPLCGHHHDLKTTKGWALVPGTGRRVMVPPDHPQHPDRRETTPDRPPNHSQHPGSQDTDTTPRSPERPAALAGSAA